MNITALLGMVLMVIGVGIWAWIAFMWVMSRK